MSFFQDLNFVCDGRGTHKRRLIATFAKSDLNGKSAEWSDYFLVAVRARILGRPTVTKYAKQDASGTLFMKCPGCKTETRLSAESLERVASAALSAGVFEINLGNLKT